MLKGNQPSDGGNLCLSSNERQNLLSKSPQASRFIMRYVGSQEIIRGEQRFCIWIEDGDKDKARLIPALKERFDRVAEARSNSVAPSTRLYAAFPYKFRQIQDVGEKFTIAIPSVSSERREFLPVDLYGARTVVSNLAFALYDAPIFNLAIIASRLHLVWIGTVCGKLKTDYRYSNTLGWNTFPLPTFSDQNKADLGRCAENILLARETHFPATIAQLYDPEKMPANLREAHEQNDETLERIYIGRRFKNDTERLEKLFELYTEMTAKQGDGQKPAKRKTKGTPK